MILIIVIWKTCWQSEGHVLICLLLNPSLWSFSMSRILLGTICGIVYGALSAASMIPLSFPDKRAALLGAFINRFAIGFVIGVARLSLPGWASGLFFGILLSLPDAIITKAYAPILILGAIGGLIIGLIVGKWGV
jgi:hypothetical protein